MEVGQRFYYLEIPGKPPLMNHGPDGRTRPRRKSRLGLTLDFRADRIRLSLYLSEIRAQEIAVKLRRQVHAGAVVAHLRRSLERGIDASLAGRSSRLKIIHESIAPREWLAALQRLPSIVLRTLAGRLKQWVVGGLAELLPAECADVHRVDRGPGRRDHPRRHHRRSTRVRATAPGASRQRRFAEQLANPGGQAVRLRPRCPGACR